MRVLAQQWTSLDGYAAGPRGEVELFEAVPPEADAASQRWNLALLDDVDLLLLGRRTYELFVDYWPWSDEPIAAALNAQAKVVCSGSLEAAPWPGFTPARVERDAVSFVRSLRDSPGTVLIWGSLSTQGALLAAGELDELELFIAPVALGVGTPLLTSPTRLRQLDVGSLGGAARIHYAVEPPPHLGT